MRTRRDVGRLVQIAICLVLLLLPAMAGSAEGDGWRPVQSASQGYSLQCPTNALVRRYDPEGILHVELADYQVLTVRVHDNPDNLSAHQWTQRWLSSSTGIDSGDGVPELSPLVPVVERSEVMVGILPAESLLLAGPTAMTRRIILTTASQVYLIDYPLGHEINERIFDRILATFETGAFAGDSGLQVIARDTLTGIPTLPVPYYSQRDPAWVCDQLGTCNCNFNVCTTQSFTTIGDAGCFITSQAMVFQYYTQSQFMNPPQYDTCLTNNGGYGSWGGCDYGLCGAAYDPPAACQPGSVSYGGYSTDLGLLDSDLAQGYPAIAWVDGGKHYVVVTGKTGWGSYDVNDPYYSRITIAPGEIVHFVRYSGPVVPGPTPPASTWCLRPLLRYWSASTQKHFYTAAWDELGGGSGGWAYETFEGYVAAEPNCYGSAGAPFYRLWHPTRLRHFYTASEAERDYAIELGFLLEGITGYVPLQPDDAHFTQPLYRCYSSTQDDHFYTSSWAEVEAAVGYGYQYEGIVAYIFRSEALTARYRVFAPILRK